MCAFVRVLLCCALWNTLQAQPWAAVDLHRDLDSLVVFLEHDLPVPYHYHDSLLFQERLAQTKERLQGSISSLQWFAALHYLLAGVGEGHIQIGQAHDLPYAGFVQGHFKSFPLTIKHHQGRLYVWNNYSSKDHWQRGDELYTINGYSIDSLQRIFYQYTLADAQIKSSRDQAWQKEFSARYFWWVEQPEQFVISYSPKDSTVVLVDTLQALTMQQMAIWAKERDQIPQQVMGMDALYTLRQEGPIAILRLRTFELNRWQAYDLEPAIFYATLFKRLRQLRIQALVIDLRGNKGGERSFVDDFLPYLPLRNAKAMYQTCYRRGQLPLHYTLPKRSPCFFRGKLCVLIDGETYSSASLMAQWAQYYGGATLMGTETGSRRAGFFGGTTSKRRLPHSGTVITLPTMLVEQEDQRSLEAELPLQLGVQAMPPHYQTPTLEGLLEGRDEVLEHALQWCRD